MKNNLIAVIWGFVESTVFFVVPDVWLTMIARNNLKKALIASFYALFGAIIGGTVWYTLSATDSDTAFMLMDKLPKVTFQSIEYAQNELKESAFWNMIVSPWIGTYYKLYAVSANSSGIDYWTFILYTIPTRLTRFILLVLFIHYTIKTLEYFNIKVNRLVFVLFFWIIIYAYYP